MSRNNIDGSDGNSNNNQENNIFHKIFQIIKKPRTQIVAGVTVISLGIAGYSGLTILVKRIIPQRVEKQLNQILGREVDLGNVTSFSLNHLIIQDTLIPPTEKDASYLEIDRVKADFNLISLLWQRSLPVYITVDRVIGLAELDTLIDFKDRGQPLPETLKLPALPITLDLKLRLKEAILTIEAQKDSPPTQLKLQTEIDFTYDNQNQPLAYNVKAAIAQGNIQLKGETSLTTTESKNRLKITRLPLGEITQLIGQFPLTLKQGEVNANLDVNLPSLKEIENLSINGGLTLVDFEANLHKNPNLKQIAKISETPLTANALLLFEDSNLYIKEAQANLGDFGASLGGSVNLEKGFDLKVDVNDTKASEIFKFLALDLPVKTEGLIKANLQVKGAIKGPRIVVNIQSKNTVVDRILLGDVKTKFQANLSDFVLEEFSVNPPAGGQVTAQGVVKTNLKKTIANREKFNLASLPFDVKFKANLPLGKLIAPYQIFPEGITVGNLLAQGEIKGNFKNPKSSAKFEITRISTSNNQQISGRGNLLLADNKFTIYNSELTADDGTVTVDASGNLKNKNWQANLVSNQINLTPFIAQFCRTSLACPNDRIDLSRPIILTDANIELNGTLEAIALDRIEGKANLGLNIDGGSLIVDSRLDSGEIQALARARKIPMQNLIRDLDANATLISSDINIDANVKELFYLPSQIPSSLQVSADNQLAIGEGIVSVKTNFNSDSLELTAITNNFSPRDILPTIPLQVNALDATVNLNARFPELLTFANNYLQAKTLTSLDSLTINTDANLEVANGRVSLMANLNNNRWQAKINTNQISIENLANQLSLLPDNQSLNLPRLDAQLDLAGRFDSLLQPSPSLPVRAKFVSLNLGANKVKATGDLTLINLLTQPDVSNLNLSVKADSDLATLPLNSILDALKGNILLPQKIDLAGKASFDGNIQGKHILATPLNQADLAIKGNLTLANFRVNNTKFEPLLTGNVTIIPAEKIALNLTGKQDAIAGGAASLLAVSLSAKDWHIPKFNLTLPYTPEQITIRQGGRGGIFVEGQRQDEQFLAKVHNLPLDLFNVAPGREYGILGVITGEVEGEIAINLSDLNSSGKIAIAQPGIGNVRGEEIAANFSYRDDVATLKQASLKFGQTEYDLQGALNLSTGEISGKVNLQGDVDDIFKTIKITDLQTITALVEKIQRDEPFASANALTSKSLDTNNDSLKEQLAILSKIDAQIKQKAKQIEAGAIPNELEITGKYSGEITLAGQIDNPEIKVNFAGENWEWLPQQQFPNIVQSLGLVMEETQAVAIPEIAIAAVYRDRQLTLKPFEIEIGSSRISFSGDISPERQKGTFAIEEFPLELVRDFFSIPVDISGNLNLAGNLEGNFNDPQFRGNFNLEDIALGGEILEQTIAGEFNYQDYRLNLNTKAPEEIKVAAILPYHPLVKTEQSAQIKVDLDTDAIALIGPLTNGQIELSAGEARANIEVEIASLDNLISDLSTKNFSLDNLAGDLKLTGNLVLDEAQLTSIALSNPVNVSGKVTLLDQTKAIQIEEINANINDTEIKIAGVLPLLKPIKDNEDPLRVTIPEQPLDLEELYSGTIDGDIEIRGTALTPEIGGQLSLINGNVALLRRTSVEKIKHTELWYQWLGEISQKTAGIFQPKLTNFQVNLDRLQLAQWEIYRFLLEGNLAVDGQLLDFRNLQADGAIDLRRGAIYLGGSRLAGGVGTSSFAEGTGQTTFFLSRANDNKITFDPKDSILNPAINLQVEADITDYSRELGQPGRNEVSEPIVRSGRGETIRVTLAIDGRLQQLLPSLAGDGTQFCNVRSDAPIAEGLQLSASQLEGVAKCVNIGALQEKGSNLGLLNSPLVELSSVPNRSEGELTNLIIGGELLNLAGQLQALSSEELIQAGFVQFILVPLANNVSFVVNETVSTWGKPLGMKDLRIFPLIEGVYEIQEKNNVSVSYDYIYNEFKVRYQMRF